jgi:hypothetical protein
MTSVRKNRMNPFDVMNLVGLFLLLLSIYSCESKITVQKKDGTMRLQKDGDHGSIDLVDELQLIDGSNQSSTVGKDFSKSLIVKALKNHVPVQGQTVDFKITSTVLGTLSTSAAQTDKDGFARITIKAGLSAGTLSVRASSGSSVLDVNFKILADAASAVTTAIAAPSGTIAVPGSTTTVAIGGSITVTMSVTTAVPSIAVKTYATTASNVACSSGTLTNSTNLPGTGSYGVSISTAGFTPGIYYFCFTMADGVNAEVTSSYSSGVVAYTVGQCTWSGLSSQAFSAAANWVGCPSAGAPTSTDAVLILSQPINQPIVSSNSTIAGFSDGVGGGTVTVNAGVSLLLSSANTVGFGSSVRLVGATPTCDTCIVTTSASSDLIVRNGATLTLGSGIKITVSYLKAFYVGDGTTYGSFVSEADSTSDPATWPEITSSSPSGFTFFGVYINGTSSNRSRIKLNGFKIGKSTVNNSTHVFNFVDYYEVISFDHVLLASDNTRVAFNGIKLTGCANSLFDTLTWSDIRFQNPMVRNINNGCATGLSGLTISGSGDGFGQSMEVDGANKINWTDGAQVTCTWTGAVNTDWATSGNWSSCSNAHGNIPNGNDKVIIPIAANQPTVSSDRFIYAVETGTGGGTVTVAAGAALVISSGGIKSSIGLQGATPTCTTCYVSFPVVFSAMTVSSGAELTLLRGIYLTLSNESNLSISSSGKLTTNGGPTEAEWPRITALSTYASGLGFNGTSGQKAIANVNGLVLENMKSSNNDMDFGNHYTIQSLSNLTISTASASKSAAGKAYISFSNCANATFSNVTWSGLNFAKSVTGSAYNILLPSGCGGLGASSVTITPGSSSGGLGYGATYASDPGSSLNWN